MTFPGASSRPCPSSSCPSTGACRSRRRGRRSTDERRREGDRAAARGGRALRPRRGPAVPERRLRRSSTSPGSPSTAARAGGTRTRVIEVGAEGNHAEMNEAPRGPAPSARRGRSTLTYPEDAAPHSPARSVRYTMTLKAIKTQGPARRSTTSSPRTSASGRASRRCATRSASGSRPPRSAGSTARRERRARRRARRQGRLRGARGPRRAAHDRAHGERRPRASPTQGIDPSQAPASTGASSARTSARRPSAPRGPTFCSTRSRSARASRPSTARSRARSRGSPSARGAPPTPCARRWRRRASSARSRARIREDKTLDLIKASARIEAE